MRRIDGGLRQAVVLEFVYRCSLEFGVGMVYEVIKSSRESGTKVLKALRDGSLIRHKASLSAIPTNSLCFAVGVLLPLTEHSPGVPRMTPGFLGRHVCDHCRSTNCISLKRPPSGPSRSRGEL
jgi:hypothetical protein